MSAEKRSVHTDALATLGTIIDETAGRDAIHLAVEPSIAAEKLFPGQDVGFVEGGIGASATPVGIVDPFLKAPVQPGQRFWLVVYPRQITSLRHVWEHPAFEGSKAAPAPVVSEKSTSEKWMRAWAMKHMSEDYYGDSGRLSEEVAYSQAIEAGRRNHIGPYESARDSIDSEWWTHWELITGMPGDRETYFSCSC